MMQIQNQETGRSFGRSIQSTPETDGESLIAIFEAHQETEDAIKQLHRCRFDMKKLSLIGRDFQTEQNIVGFYNLGDRANYWGNQRAFWRGIWGLLSGSAMFIVPGVGPLVIAGAFVSTLVGAIDGATSVGGPPALGAALFSVGIPKDSIGHYERALKTGSYVLIAHGSPDDIEKAKVIVNNSGAKKAGTYVWQNAPRPEKVTAPVKSPFNQFYAR